MEYIYLITSACDLRHVAMAGYHRFGTPGSIRHLEWLGGVSQNEKIWSGERPSKGAHVHACPLGRTTRPVLLANARGSEQMAASRLLQCISLVLLGCYSLCGSVQKCAGCCAQQLLWNMYKYRRFRIPSLWCALLQTAWDGFEGREDHRIPFAPTRSIRVRRGLLQIPRLRCA